jgi:streptogramin lyase
MLRLAMPGDSERLTGARRVRMAAMGWRLVSLSVILAVWGAHAAFAQASYPCVNDAPDPYQRGVSFAPLPDGRVWGSTAGVAVAADGTIWAYDRCGANSCAGSPLDPIIAFSPDGKVRRRFGGGLFQMPHSLTVDDAGNVWVTDNAAKDGRGMQVYKFSPQGQILMTLGKPGGGEAPDGFFQPNAVAIASNGDIFVARTHRARRQVAHSCLFTRRQIHQIIWRQGQWAGRT